MIWFLYAQAEQYSIKLGLPEKMKGLPRSDAER